MLSPLAMHTSLHKPDTPCSLTHSAFSLLLLAQADNNLSLIEYELVTIPAEHAAAATSAAQPATA